MKKKLLFLLSAILSFSYVFAQSSANINVSTPGTLAQLIGDGKTTITDLTVIGTINDADFAIFKQMTVLKNLDLKNVNCEVIPAKAFAELNVSKITLPINVKVIKEFAFDLIKIDALDFSSCTNLEELGYSAFSLSQIKNNVIDLSKNEKLTRFPSYGSIWGTFREYNGHVILSQSMTELPNMIFQLFKGSVELPRNLKAIGTNAFASSNMSAPLVIPQLVEEIRGNAFQKAIINYELKLTHLKNLKIIKEFAFDLAKIDKLDLSGCTNLEEIGYSAFSFIQMENNVIDLSKNEKLIRFPSYGPVWGTFREYNGHVILNQSMTEISPLMFKEFKGTVKLPNNLRIIRENAFEKSTIKNITIPKSIAQIEKYAFYGCVSLQEINSLNLTPPTLGVNVFLGIDKNTCQLVVPYASLNLYLAADQWKDFLNAKSDIEPEVPLTFKLKLNVNGYVIDDSKLVTDSNKTIGRNNPPAGVPEVKEEELRIETKATRIGEYYWTDVLNMHVPHFLWWNTNEGSMARYPLTQEIFDLYMGQIHIDYAKFTPEISDFNKYYGQYYDVFTSIYMNAHGLMYEGDRLDSNLPLPGPAGEIEKLRPIAGPGWDMAYMRDYRQLFGMCPFFTEGNTKLDELDVRSALSYKKGENPLTIDFNNGTPLRTYWFEGNINTNMHGFNMMPGGSRLHAADAYWTNGLSYGYDYVEAAGLGHLTNRYPIQTKGGTIEGWMGPKGAFSHLFYSVSYRAKDGVIFIHDRVDTGIYSDFAMPIRWSRRLTDIELGYKLFIKMNTVNISSQEYTQLVANDEIPLLKQIREGVYSTQGFDIVKIDDAEAIAPEGYIELPNGYIRGFYVQYFIQNPASKKTVSDVMLYASSVDDKILYTKDELAKLKEDEENGKSTKSSKAVMSINETVVTESSVSIFPNPVEDMLNIESTDKINLVSIFSTTGAKVKEFANVSNGINVSDLTPGTYIVKVTTSKNVVTSKILKK